MRNGTARWSTNAEPKVVRATMPVPMTQGSQPAVHGPEHRTRAHPHNPHSSVPRNRLFLSSFYRQETSEQRDIITCPQSQKWQN